MKTFHLSLQVLDLPAYQQWMAAFGNDTRHVLLNAQAMSSSVSLPSPATVQVRVVHWIDVTPCNNPAKPVTTHSSMATVLCGTDPVSSAVFFCSKKAIS